MKKYLCGVNFLFVGLLVLMVAGCGTLRVNKQSQKTADVKLIQQTKVYQLAKSCVSWDGALLPAYSQGQPEITILRIVIPVGETLVKHKHPVINAGVLLKGELTVKTEGGKTLHLKAGEALVEVVDTWHYGKNEGTEPAEIIVFYAGTEDAPITVHKLD
jgi:quercetin dioxygenase-like cupin family protein